MHVVDCGAKNCDAHICVKILLLPQLASEFLPVPGSGITLVFARVIELAAPLLIIIYAWITESLPGPACPLNIAVQLPRLSRVSGGRPVKSSSASIFCRN
jgi:hypothetical protein